MTWTIEDTRTSIQDQFKNAKTGDFVIDNDDDMYIIIFTYDEEFALLNISNGDFGTSIGYDSVLELLEYWDEDYGVREVVPSERISIKIS